MKIMQSFAILQDKRRRKYRHAQPFQRTAHTGSERITQYSQSLHDILDDEHGYEVELSNFTFENADSVERLHPDLLILDFSTVDQKEPWQLLQMLKMYEPTASIPIIVCTNALLSFREQKAHFQRQNIKLLYKPFQKDELLESVQQMLEGHSK